MTAGALVRHRAILSTGSYGPFHQHCISGVYMLCIRDYISLHRENSGRRHFGGSWKSLARQLVGFRRYLRPKPAWDGSWAALGRLWGALGRLLGGSGEALGRLLEASRRHLGAEAVIARILDDFCKISEILGGHLGRLLTSKIDFFRDPRGCPRRRRF